MSGASTVSSRVAERPRTLAEMKALQAERAKAAIESADNEVVEAGEVIVPFDSLPREKKVELQDLTPVVAVDVSVKPESNGLLMDPPGGLIFLILFAMVWFLKKL
jgi:hypothetical protein